MLTQDQVAQLRTSAGLSPTAPPAPNPQYAQIIAQRQAALNQPTQTPVQPTNTSALPPTTAYGKATDILQDVGNAAGAANNALTGNTGTVADYINPISWVTHAIGGAANVLAGGLNATVNPLVENLASMAGTAIRNAVGANNVDALKAGIKNAINSPLAQSLIKTYTAPDVVSDLNAVKNIAGTAGIITGAGQTAEAMQDVIPAVKYGASAVGNMIPASVKNAVVGAPQTAEGTTGQIVQGTGNEIPTAQRALTSIDTSGVKTFSDLSDKLNEAIKTNTASVDAELGQDDGLYTPADVEKSVPVSGQVPATDETGAPILNKDGTPQMTTASPITTDPVSDALNQLKQFYDKTGDTENLARIQGLQNEYENGDGLSLKQINDIAREHGAELNGYNANGELASGLGKQAAENTRTALKGVVRDLNGPDDTTEATDANTSDLIKTKDMVDDMSNKVQQLQNKLQNYGMLQKFGRFAGRAFDMFTGGIVKGFLKSIMGIGQGQGVTMNALQLQNALQGNLSLLTQLNAMPDAEAVATLGRLVSSAPVVAQQSVLPAIAVSSQNQPNQKTQKSHQKTSKGTKSASMSGKKKTL